MKTVFMILVPTAILTSLSSWSVAHPPNAILYGNSCATCHGLAPDDGGLQGGGEVRPNALSVLSSSRFDPDELLGTPPQDWKDRGELKLFAARPGETIDLTVQVEHGATEYALQLKRFEKEGFSGAGNVLVGHVTPDPDWLPQGFDDSTYYTNSPDDFDGYDWLEGSVDPVAYSFSLTLGPDTPLDLYDLEFATAGIDPATEHGKWYGDEHFYLRVVPEPCTNVLFGISCSCCCLCRRRRQTRLR